LKKGVVVEGDFFYSVHFTTMIAIVPKSGVEDWKKNYEMMSEYVVPESTK